MARIAERANESRYRRLLELAFESIVIIAEETIVSANSQAIELLKAENVGDLIGEPISRFLDPISLDEFRLAVQCAMAGDGEIPLFEQQLRRLDHAYVDVEAVGLVVTVQGKPAVQLVIRDITERKQADLATSVRDSWFRGLLQAAPDAVLIAEEDGTVVLVNEQLETMFGYGRKELIGLRVEQLIPEQLRDRHVQHRRKYAHNPFFRTMSDAPELAGRRKDGRTFPIEVKLDPLFTHDGFHVICIIRDVGDCRQIDSYAVRVERLAALGQMTAVLAHELNNPLQIIRGYLDMVLDLPVEAAEKEEYLRLVQGQIARLQDVSSRILDYAQPRSDVSQLVGLADLAKQVLNFASKQLQDRRIRVATDFQDAPPVKVVPDHMIQVFLNLVLNSIDSAADGGTLEVALRSDEQQTAISFTTYGPTIPPEDLTQIFEAYYTTKSAGVGLGLWICRDLVAQNNGELVAENLADGQGVVFSVIFPRSLPMNGKR